MTLKAAATLLAAVFWCQAASAQPVSINKRHAYEGPRRPALCRASTSSL